MISIRRSTQRAAGSPSTIEKTFLDRAPAPGKIKHLKATVRKALLEYIRDLNRERVLKTSTGAGGTSLQGYSTRPIRIGYPARGKRILRPKGGIRVKGGMYFPGGYRQYKQATGQVSERFTFFNTGDAWRDWRVLTYGSDSTSGKIGFSKPENAIAANAAISKRPLLFRLDKEELSMVNDRVLGVLNTLFIPS